MDYKIYSYGQNLEDDEFSKVLEAMKKAGTIVIGSPVYWHNVPDDFLELTLIYFRIYAIGLIFQFGYNIFSSILRAVGDSAATLYWWNGLFGFGMGFLITWTYYLSGRWQRNSVI